MAHQNAGNTAQVHPYGPDIKDPPDKLPSDKQPPGVDEDIDLEEALTSL